MKSLCYASLTEIARKIRAKELSALELVEAHLARISVLQPTLNAFVYVDAEEALRRARDADAAVLHGEQIGPLHGVPFSVKSCIDVAGWPCPAGSLLRRDEVPASTAPLVQRLLTAGGIPLGNTNTPEFLMAYETNNRLYGKTCNPWDLEYSAGGSSGGEAAAIAAGLSAGGIGSDGGGSIRVPAHFCGICGLKPTSGRIPGTGHFPPGNSSFGWLGVCGPMARTVGDLRILFEAMVGPDSFDALTAPVPFWQTPANSNGGIRIGIIESDEFTKVSPQTNLAVGKAAQLLSDKGFVLEPFRLANISRMLELWWFFFGSVIGEIILAQVAGKEGQLSPILLEYLEISRRDSPISMQEFVGNCAARDLERGRVLKAMADVPVLLSPVSTRPAFRHGEGHWRPDDGYREMMQQSQWLNLTGMPGVSLPICNSDEGLPIGVQLIGRPFEEELLLAVAERLEEARGPWKAPSLSQGNTDLQGC
jgi:Asp-tRNA(Asn)/Glu-tRNA(Gln) amidotransferase A subunit family amidase